MKCEVCGEEDDLKKTNVEGAVLQLCEDCQETGEVVESSSSTGSSRSGSRKKSSRKRRKPKQQQKHLVRDFDSKVKQAREDRDWTVEDLADRLKVKESIVHRIESGKLKPDQDLAKKLRKTLDVELYERASEADYESMRSDSAGGEATIGDVAKVRKRD